MKHIFRNAPAKRYARATLCCSACAPPRPALKARTPEPRGTSRSISAARAGTSSSSGVERDFSYDMPQPGASYRVPLRVQWIRRPKEVAAFMNGAGRAIGYTRNSKAKVSNLRPRPRPRRDSGTARREGAAPRIVLSSQHRPFPCRNVTP